MWHPTFTQYQLSVALSGLEIFLTIYPGRHSFHFACPGLFSFGLTALSIGKFYDFAEEAELSRLWKKLVKLYHPDRFAHEPDKLETYPKLTGAINQAKDTGDIETLREIAEDPHGFMLRQGWAKLDFKDVEELAQLKRLH